MALSDNAELADYRSRLRHSTAHVMADVVTQMFPMAKLAIGPPTDDGFYYDFLVGEPFKEEDLEEIERRMSLVIAQDSKFEYAEYTRDEALAMHADEPLKLEIIESIPDNESISTYSHGDFEDLCAGPHVESTGKIPAFKLLSLASAYWRGDESRPMLQRIYGTAFESQDELDKHLEQLAEAKRRDHRRIGEDLGLFAFSREVGRGLPLWLPKGTVIRDALEDWAKQTERKWGYQRVVTPHIARAELFEISGHLAYFKDEMYAASETEGEEYYLKPVNCPHHHMVYKAQPHSYRELPLRYAEYGTVYRYERSGQLFGLMRPRGFTQNDSHIYCTFDQARQEFLDVMRLHEYYYSILGITDYHMVLALRDPENDEKYHGDAQMWQDAERITREAMEESGIDYVEEVGGASHYGPKVDFVIRSVTGREFGISTNQVDLYMPGRFDLTYVDSSGQDRHPVVIHRAPLGSHERFVAFLIEHFAGAFPAWLAPTQVKVIPVADRHLEYARTVANRIDDRNLRVEVDDTNNRMQQKIRQAQLEKVPYMLVVGDREIEADTVAVRLRTGEDLGARPVAEFIDLLWTVVDSKSLHLTPTEV